MRKPRALATLFPTVRGDVLAATLNQPDKWWYLSELAQFLQDHAFEPAARTQSTRRGGHPTAAPTRKYFKA